MKIFVNTHTAERFTELVQKRMLLCFGVAEYRIWFTKQNKGAMLSQKLSKVCNNTSIDLFYLVSTPGITTTPSSRDEQSQKSTLSSTETTEILYLSPRNDQMFQKAKMYE